MAKRPYSDVTKNSDFDRKYIEIQVKQIKSLFEAVKNDHIEMHRQMQSIQSGNRSMEAQFRKVGIDQQQLLSEIGKRNEMMAKHDLTAALQKLESSVAELKTNKNRAANLNYVEQELDSPDDDLPLSNMRKVQPSKNVNVKQTKALNSTPVQQGIITVEDDPVKSNTRLVTTPIKPIPSTSGVKVQRLNKTQTKATLPSDPLQLVLTDPLKVENDDDHGDPLSDVMDSILTRFSQKPTK